MSRRLSFLHVYHHATVVVIGSGCSGIWGWCFDAVFIATLLYLFLDFHKKTYSGGGSKKKASNLTVNGNGQVNGVEVFDFVKPLKQA
ncbi:hypothetical protein LINGRAHAP2_LOCUS12557 [Linum grandiflorum]